MPVGGTFRLFLLVALALLPMIAIQAWHERDLRDERGGIIRERVIYRTQQLAAEIGELREGARQLLLAIAQLEAVKLQQPEACSTLLAKLRSRYPNYSLLGAADAQGRIFCASGPTTASVANQSFFTQSIAHDGLAVGNYWVNPATGQKMINFGQQFDDSNGCLAGVIFAGLDLTWLSDHLKGNGLPPTSSKLIADREGNIIARLPRPEEYVGKNMRGSHETIMDGGMEVRTCAVPKNRFRDVPRNPDFTIDQDTASRSVRRFSPASAGRPLLGFYRIAFEEQRLADECRNRGFLVRFGNQECRLRPFAGEKAFRICGNEDHRDLECGE